MKPNQQVAAFVLVSHQILCVFFLNSLEGAANGAPLPSQVGNAPALIQSNDLLEATAMESFKKFLETSAASLRGDLGLVLNSEEKKQYIDDALREYSQFTNTIAKGFKMPEANTIDNGNARLNSEYRAAISGMSSGKPRESSDPNGNGSPFFFQKSGGA